MVEQVLATGLVSDENFTVDGTLIQSWVSLTPEAKHLTDTIKMPAYRAETAMVEALEPHYAKTKDEGRALSARECGVKCRWG